MKKAFTLIELLSVIIILGIIALIAVPVTSRIIDEARIGAFKRSVENIEDAVGRKVAMDLLKGDNSEKSYVYSDGKSTSGDLDKAFKGKRPDEAIIHVNSSGEIEYAIYDKDLKVCVSKSYESSEYEVSKNINDKNECLGMLTIALLMDSSIGEKSGIKTFANKIISVSFVNNSEMIEGQPITYDLSLDEDESVLGYLMPAANNMFDLYVYSPGKIYAPANFYFFEDMNNLVSVDFANLSTINTVNMSNLFYWCSSLEEIKNIQNLNTSKVTTMRNMFAQNESLVSLDLSSFDTSSLTDMNGMFYECSSLEYLNISGFNTSKVIDMNGVFESCRSLLSINLSNFNTSNVTDMFAMFFECESLTSLDLTSFDITNVTDMDDMFDETINLEVIYVNSNWNTDNKNTEYGMFTNSKIDHVTVKS